MGYPLLSLYEASKSLDGKEIDVVGYLGVLDGDIPVLYATQENYMNKELLYKSHILFSEKEVPISNHLGKLCTIKTKVWYRGTVPTLDQSKILGCK